MREQKKYKIKCKYCEYEWLTRIEKPKACPRCKIYIRWDKWVKIKTVEGEDDRKNM